MLWNELSYEIQAKVLEKIQSLLEKERDFDLRKGIVAALTELDMWSNAPCPEIVDMSGEEFDVQCIFDHEDSAVSAVQIDE